MAVITMINAKLDTLLAVAELLNYTKAAQALSLTQPAVSQHIRQLEADYEITIFRRGEKPLVLTREGEVLVQYARKIKNLHERMQVQLSDQKCKKRQLSIGVTETTMSSGIVETLAKFEKQIDCASIQIYTDEAKNLLDMLRNYSLDLAIVEGSVSEADFYSLSIDSDQLFAAVSPLNSLSHRTVVTLEDLKAQRMILRGGSSGTRILWENQLRQLFETIESFRVVMELDSVNAIKELVKKDYGISILSMRSCAAEVEEGTLVLLPIENKRMIREVNLVCLKEAEQVGTVQMLKRVYDNR